MSTESEKRSDFIQKIMAGSPRHEPEVEEAERSLKEARMAIPTPMLDIVFRSGKVRSLSYAHLDEVEFEPGDTLVLKYITGKKVTIEGRGLARHRQSVRLHRADELKESTEPEPLQDGEDITYIENIHIDEGEKQ
jgi:hypothetical protein